MINEYIKMILKIIYNIVIIIISIYHLYIRIEINDKVLRYVKYGRII